MRLGQAVGAEQLRRRPCPGSRSRRCASVPNCVDRVAGERVHADAEGDAGPPRGQLLDHLQVDGVGLPAAADVLAEGQAEQAGLARACGRPPAGSAPRARTAAACGASSASARSRVSASRSSASRVGSSRSTGTGLLLTWGTVLSDGTAVLSSGPGSCWTRRERRAMTSTVPSADAGADPPSGGAARPARGALPGRGVRPVHARGPRPPAALLQEHALRAGREQGAAGPARDQALLPQGDRRPSRPTRSPWATRRCGSRPT